MLRNICCSATVFAQHIAASSLDIYLSGKIHFKKKIFNINNLQKSAKK